MNKFEELQEKMLKKLSNFMYPQGESAKSELAALLTAYDESKWKSYPENMPDKIQIYQITYKTKFQSKASVTANLLTTESYFVSEELWLGLKWNTGFNIIAYQELPQPYTGKEE